ncbi:MAG: 16S rRNA (guanine(527)-N(7))-methyltransferase RsmG [Bacteroidales bacterium]|nr:16S rRNA (guanine(527)-N(7))-methyltransferase RsmG [Bacteroidales bacterium]
MNKQEFTDFARKEFSLNERQIGQFEALEGLYREWNSKINVISRKDIDNLYAHHVLHSLSIAKYLAAEPGRLEKFSRGKILDLGTGGGFPGIPLAILFPQAHFTLCDSIGKKITVAREVAAGIDLKNVDTVNARVETLGERFDFIVSRAVATLSDLYPWVRGKFSDGLICLKGGDIAEESALAMARFHLSKGSIATWKVSDWLSDPYFEGKFITDLK